MLIQDIWKPTLGFVILLALLIVAVAGYLPVSLPPEIIAGVLFIAFLPLAGWWLYIFVDWKNDIYMVTADQTGIAKDGQS